ncbi:MAG: AraC family transcriptional regulator [Verrucomicrobiota bacterium]
MDKDHIDFPLEWESSSYRVVSRVRRASEDKLALGIRPYFQGFNQVVISAPVTHPAHRHSSYELILVEKGPYSCRVNGESVRLDSPFCLLLKPGDVHELELSPGQRHYVLQFDLEDKSLPSSATIGIFRRHISVVDQSFPGPLSEMKPILEGIAQQSHNSHRFSSEIQDCLVEYLFWVLLSHIPEEHLSSRILRISRDQQFLDRLERIEREHRSERLTLDELAKLMEVSKSTLAKRFAKLLDETPSQYLTRRKISHAMMALQTTDSSIKEISFDLGFRNPYHFSRVFKKMTGSSPSDFRESKEPNSKDGSF